MEKKDKLWIAVTGMIVLIPMFAGIVLWNSLPDIPATYFDANGTADGWSPKEAAVFGLPLLMLAVMITAVAVPFAYSFWITGNSNLIKDLTNIAG